MTTNKSSVSKSKGNKKKGVTKPKSLKKKLTHSTNTFKFENFLDRVSRVSINDVRYKKAADEALLDPNEQSHTQTHFSEAFAKWTELDCSENFEVVDLLLEHLALTDSISFEAILDLTSSLACDLAGDFYPHFWATFDRILGLIDAQPLASPNTQLLESCFGTLAFLFKILWRRMVPEMNLILKRTLPLFTHGREFIRRFAAEALAFLIRKCSDKQQLIDTLYGVIDTEFTASLQDPGVQGCAEMLFQAMRSTTATGNVYSVAEEFFSECVRECVKQPNINTAHWITVAVCDKLANHCTELHAKPFINILLCKMREACSTVTMTSCLRLLHCWMTQDYVTQHFGVVICDTLTATLTHNSALTIDNLTYWLQSIALLTTAKIDKMNNRKEYLVSIDKLLTSIVSNLPSKCHTDLLEFFNEQLTDNTDEQVARIVLGPYLCFVESIVTDSTLTGVILQSLCSVQLQKQPIKMGFQFKSIDTIQINNRSQILNGMGPKTRSLIQQCFRAETQMVNSFYSILLTPAISDDTEQSIDAKLIKTDNQSINEQLSNVLMKCVRRMERAECRACAWACLQSLGQSNANSMQVKHALKHVEGIDAVKLIEWLSAYKDVFSVRLVELCVHWLDISIDSDQYNRFLSVLSPAVFTQNVNTRMLIYSILGKALRIITPASTEDNCLDILLMVEQVPLSLDSYRQRLVLLRRVIASTNHITDVDDTIATNTLLFCVRGIASQLYVPFTLLWPIVNETLASVSDLPKVQNQFWDVWLALLKQLQTDNQDNNCVEDDRLIAMSSVFSTNMEYATDSKSKVRSVTNESVRVQWWKCTALFVPKAERHARTLCEYLLRYSREHVQNRSPALIDYSKEDYGKEDRPKNKDHSNHGKLLLAALEVFGRFSDARSVYKSGELQTMYKMLLSMPDEAVQKAALKCLLCYKKKAVTQYSENFGRLLDDKTFRDELVLCTFGSEESVIAVEHRAAVAELLIPLLHGRMRRAVGGKASHDSTQRAVMRYVAGCNANEVHDFVAYTLHNLRYLCAHFGKGFDLINLEHLHVVQMADAIDLSELLHPSKITNLLADIRELVHRLSAVLCDQSIRLLWESSLLIGRLLIRLTVTLNEKIHSKVLKQLRNQITLTFSQFFTSIETYSWQSDELKQMFELWIEPQIQFVPHNQSDLVCNVTLLRLFAVWAKKPCYAALLNVPVTVNGRKSTCMELSIRTLLHTTNENSKWHQILLEIVHELLSNADETSTLPKDMITDSSAFGNHIEAVNNQANYGTRLLAANIDCLLEYLSRLVQAAAKKKKASTRILDILRDISIYVNDDQHADQLIGTLLTVARGHIAPRHADTQVQLFECIALLMKSCSDPSQYIQCLTPFVSSVSERAGRDSLIQVLCVVVHKCNDQQQTMARALQLIIDMNKWDARRVEEPDFEKRQLAHTAVFRLLEESEDVCLVDMSLLCTMLLHQSWHILSMVRDLALRENAIHCLVLLLKYSQTVCDKLNIDNANMRNELLHDQFLPLLLKHLKTSDEPCFTDCIHLLGEAANHCAEQLPALRSLVNHTEHDLDIYKQLCHIQVARRSRAMRRLVKRLQDAVTVEGEGYCRESCKYLLPIAQHYVQVDEHKPDSDLANAGIELLGCVAGLLPWRPYAQLLMGYTKRLGDSQDKSKRIIRTISALLDAYHFEPKSQTKIDSAADENQKNETEMDVENGEEAEKLTGDTQELVIARTMSRKLLPSLTALLSDQRLYGRGAYENADELLIARAPIALAIVQLLLRMPEEITELHLPMIIGKMCEFLRSRALSVRRVARDTLANAAIALGPRYLPFVIRELRVLLVKGYQLHVMNYTVHYVIGELDKSLKAPDLDVPLNDLSEVCQDALFGTVAEQRDIDEVRNSTPEAKQANRAVDTLRTLSRCLHKSSLNKLLAPFQKLLAIRHQATVVRKAEEALKQIGIGLAHNESINAMHLMTCVHSWLTDAHMALNAQKLPVKTKSVKYTVRDCRLIAPEPNRLNTTPTASNVRGTAHVWQQFAWHTLLVLLQSKTVLKDNEEHMRRLDPFVALLADALHSPHDKIVSLSLRVLCLILRLCPVSLQTDNELVQRIIGRLFVLFNDCALVQNNTAVERTQTLLNTITLILNRGGTSSTVTHNDDDDVSQSAVSRDRMLIGGPQLQTNHIRVLLQHIEACLTVEKCQTAAFGALKAVIVRVGWGSSEERRAELEQLMQTVVRPLAITSDMPHTCTHARNIMSVYLQDASIENDALITNEWFQFFVQQLQYEHEHGRLCAIEMLNLMCNKLNKSEKGSHVFVCFVHLCTVLMSDQSAKCSKLAALAIGQLIANSSSASRVQLFQMVVDWMNDKKKPVHNRLAASLVCLFAENQPKDEFAKTLTKLLPMLESKISGAIVEPEMMDSRTFVSYLVAWQKIVLVLPTVVVNKHKTTVTTLWAQLDIVSQCADLSVVIAGSQLIGQLLTAYDNLALCQLRVTVAEYSNLQCASVLHRMCYANVGMLRRNDLNQILATQCIKNLLVFSKILAEGKGSGICECSSEEFSLAVLVNRLVGVIKYELAHHAKLDIKRTAVFKWTAAMLTFVESDTVLDLLVQYLLPYVHREIVQYKQTEYEDEPSALYRMSSELSEVFRRRLGPEQYALAIQKCQSDASHKRKRRSEQAALEPILNPEVAARKRMKHNKAKADARKKRMKLEKPHKKEVKFVEGDDSGY